MHPMHCCNCGRPTFSRVTVLSESALRPLCRPCDGRLLAEGVIHLGELKNARVYPEVSEPELPPPPPPVMGRFFRPLSRLAVLLLLFSVSFG